MVIAFFVILLVIMPKNNKEERKAAHLLIDKYGIQVAKKNNPVRQMALLEVALGISTYRGSRKKTFIFIGSFFVIAFILGYLTYFFWNKPKYHSYNHCRYYFNFIFNCRNNNNVCNSDSPSIFITYRRMG